MNTSDILDYIRRAKAPVTKREIAAAFGIKGGGVRIALKQILKALEADGAVEKVGGAYTVPDGLPGAAVVEVYEIDVDGDVFARPVEWDEGSQGPSPRIEIMPGKKGHGALGMLDRALVRLSRLEDGVYAGHVIKALDKPENQVMGLLRIHKGGGGVLQPADKKAKHEYLISSDDLGGAADGDLVVGEIQPERRRVRQKKARVVEVLGRRDDPQAISLISMHEQGLKAAFPGAVVKACEGMKVPPLKGRTDLRDIPLVTIDGADARDFDDAVFAEPHGDGGFHIIVAIADVSYYVRSGSALDEEAQRRGNSTYFPDRVVPMLPEALSNDLCSLRPNENRACMAVHLWIDSTGHLERYKFVRGIMRSAARLIYEDVQKAYDSGKHELIEIIRPLYDAFKVLDQARSARGALDLDLPERQIVLDKKNRMTGVRKRDRLDAHKMIEEFMILANVAAASALEAKAGRKIAKKDQIPCVYRVHDKPGLEKLEGARDFIEAFGLSFPKGEVASPKRINAILRKAAQLPYSHLISMVILRTQSQAVYAPENIGHFGLALTKYAHFTSPIRRITGFARLEIHGDLK